MQCDPVYLAVLITSHQQLFVSEQISPRAVEWDKDFGLCRKGVLGMTVLCSNKTEFVCLCVVQRNMSLCRVVHYNINMIMD